MARRARSVAALVMLAAVCFGVPLLLVRIAGWPLPGHWPSLQRIKTALQQNDISAEAVIDTIAVLVWIAWAQLMWALTWELAVNVRATERGHPARPTPLAPRLMSSAVTCLVALTFSVGVSTISSASTALATPQPTAVAAPFEHVASRPAAVPGQDQPVESHLAASAPQWCVARGDSLWSIAETALGDGSRVTEILELNRSIRSPRELRPGQVLTLPADAQVPPDRMPATTAELSERPVESASLFAPDEIITVVAGDNLWNLADARLTRVTGNEPSGTDVLDYVNAIVAANADTIDDPNLIFPGQQFRFPAIGTPSAETQPQLEPGTDKPGDATDPVGTPLPTTAAPETVPPAAVPTTAPSMVADSTPSIPSTTPIATAAAPAASRPAPPSQRANTLGTAAVVDESVSTRSSTLPILIGVSGATALSSGLLITYRRLRHRQSAQGARAARRRSVPTAVAETERVLVAASDVPLVHWAAHELNVLFGTLAVAMDVEGVPLVVELSEEHGIEILWSVRNRIAPDPWTSTSDGWTWHLPYDEERCMPSDACSAVLPGLVTIGRRDGRQVLIDVEAFGSIAVVGDVERAEAFVRAVAFELATSEELANSFVHTAGLRLPGVEHLGRVLESDADSAVKHVRGVLRETSAVLAGVELDDTFRLRSIDGADGRELTVMVAGSCVSAPDLSDVLSELVPHRGAAGIVVGHQANARSTLTIDADGVALLLPIGLEIEAVGLPLDTATRVEVALNDTAADPVPSIDVDPEAIVEPSTLFDDIADFSSNGNGTTDDRQPPEPGLLVRILGPPRIEGFNGLTPTAISLVAFLACHGNTATEDQAINAVWNGRSVTKATLWNNISKVRSVIGSHMPARAQGEHVRLDEDVVTDLAVLKTCAYHAWESASGRAIDLLSHALGLVAGPPFDLPGYDWAYEHQYHAEASAAVEDAALQLVDLALQAGQVDTARRAIEQGLRALPANEPLYRARRMKLEAQAGNHAAVRQAYAELTRQLDELSGGTGAFDPSSQTTALLGRLSGCQP